MGWMRIGVRGEEVHRQKGVWCEKRIVWVRRDVCG